MKKYLVVCCSFFVVSCALVPSDNESFRRSVQLVFNDNGEQIYTTYIEFLKKEPYLAGSVVLQIQTVQKSDNVCRVYEADQGLLALALKVCEKVEKLDFSVGDSEPFLYPLIFSNN